MEKFIIVTAGDKIRLAFLVVITPLKIAQSIERVKSALEITLFTETMSQTGKKGYCDKCYQVYVQANYSGFMTEYKYEIPADSLTSVNREITKIISNDLPKKIERDLLYSVLNESKN